MLKTVVSIILSFAVLLSLNSNDIYKNDVSNRLIIQGIGIDQNEDDTYKITVQAINTSTHTASINENSGDTVKIYTVSGDTIYTALKSIAEFEGKIPMYSQNRVIIIGRNIAKSGIDGVIDFFNRDADSGPSVLVACAEKSAEEILSQKKEGEVIARNIDFALQSSDFEGGMYKMQMYELIDKFKGNGSFLMPLLVSKEQSKGVHTVEVSGSLLFKNGKEFKEITKEKTFAFNLLNNTIYNGEFVFTLKDNEKISLSIADCKTKRQLKITDNEPHFSFKINMECDISEIYGGVDKYLTKDKIEQIKNASEKHIENITMKFIGEYYNDEICDALGVYRLIYGKYPKFYKENQKNINTILENSKYSVDVKIRIRRVGHDYIKM